MVFVFVHKVDENNSRENLVFRYWPTADHTTVKPTVAWRSDSEVRITVGPDVIDQTTKELNSIGGVKVTYNVGDASCQPAFDWKQRLFGPECDG